MVISNEINGITMRPPGNAIFRFLKEWFYWLHLLVLGFHVPIREMLETKKKIDRLPDRTGEVAVITGGARGFGLETVKKLLQSNFRVIVGDINPGKSAIQDIQKLGLPIKNVKYLYLDLKSLKSVKLFAAKVLEETQRIDLLINNAGIMFSPYEATEDGYESQFQVNYLGHFLLTQLLLPIMKETSLKKELCCRIVNVSSAANYFAHFKVESERPENYKIYACNEAYCNSKFAQILMTKYLDKKLKTEGTKIRVYSLHPGMVPTRLWDHVIPAVNSLLTCLNRFYRTTEDGANGIIYAALAPELENEGGLYLDNCTSVAPKSNAENYALQEILWKKSLDLIQKF